MAPAAAAQRCVFKGIKLCQLQAANTAQARRLAAKIVDAVIHITEPPAEINSWPSASCCGQPLTAPPTPRPAFDNNRNSKPLHSPIFAVTCRQRVTQFNTRALLPLKPVGEGKNYLRLKGGVKGSFRRAEIRNGAGTKSENLFMLPMEISAYPPPGIRMQSTFVSTL